MVLRPITDTTTRGNNHVRKLHRMSVAAAAGAAIALFGLPAAASADVPADDDITVLASCSSFPPTPCGEVQNNTNRTVRVSLNWTCSADTAPIGSGCPRDIRNVSPGGHIGGGNVDVDAFEVPNGCTFTFNFGGAIPSNRDRGPGWYKFASVNDVTLVRARC